jgi:hypothetical protein
LGTSTQESWDITASLCDCHDLDPFALHTVKNQVGIDWPKQDGQGGEVLTFMAHPGSLGERFEGVESVLSQRSAASMLSSAM